MPKPTSFTKHNRYRPEIDGLRAFAVAMVIINHFNKNILPGGYLGVDIFFVISGYVITSSLFGRPSKDFNDFISGFYERRVKRLVPALTVFVLITSIMICLFNPSPGLSLQTGITSLFGLSNLYLLKQSTDYFAQSTELNVFTHTWSLGVEEQFYILFPFLIWFSGFGRQTKNGSRNLFLVVGALSITSLLGFLYLYSTDQAAAYFLMPSRFWEMAAGCLIFIGFQKRVSVEQFLEKVPPFLVLAVIIGVMYLPMSMASESTIAVVVLSSILIASLKKNTAAFKVFTQPKVVYIGLISYSLYLWHWGVLSISRWTIGIHWWSVPLQVGLMLVLAVSSYQWIETPLRKGNWLGKRWKTLMVGGGTLVTLSVGVKALSAESTTQIIFSGAKSKCIAFQYSTCTGASTPHIATTPFIGQTTIQREQCFTYEGAITESIINQCTISPKQENLPTFFIQGSSFAHHFSPAFENLHKNHGIGISMSVVQACDLDPLLEQTNKQGTCKESNSTRIKFLAKNAKSGDVLFTGPTGYKVNEKSVRKLSKLGRQLGVHIVYFSPIPRWPILAPGIDSLCQTGALDQWYRPSNTIDCALHSDYPRKIYDMRSNKTLQFLREIEADNPYFHVYKIHEFLCSSSSCPSHIGSTRLYRDNSGHLSVHAVRRFISDDLKALLLDKDIVTQKQ